MHAHKSSLHFIPTLDMVTSYSRTNDGGIAGRAFELYGCESPSLRFYGGREPVRFGAFWGFDEAAASFSGWQLVNQEETSQTRIKVEVQRANILQRLKCKNNNTEKGTPQSWKRSLPSRSLRQSKKKVAAGKAKQGKAAATATKRKLQMQLLSLQKLQVQRCSRSRSSNSYPHNAKRPKMLPANVHPYSEETAGKRANAGLSRGRLCHGTQSSHSARYRLDECTSTKEPQRPLPRLVCCVDSYFGD